jgi:mRNA interferase RelE/StbE
MAWKIEFSAEAERELNKLDGQVITRILKILQERVVKVDNPRNMGKALQGPRFGEFWKYRVEDYRLICKIEDARVVVLILRIGHRREIYP